MKKWALLLAVAACGTGSPGSSDSESSGTATQDTSDTSDSEGTQGGDSWEDSLCAIYIDCVRVVEPGVVSATVATYGENGSCFQIEGVTSQDCYNECSAQMSAYQMANPSVQACWACSVDADCPQSTPVCCMPPFCGEIEHSCVNPACGNELLEPGEVCDQAEACEDCVFTEHGCNPLTGDPCAYPDEVCGLSETMDGYMRFECAPAWAAVVGETVECGLFPDWPELGPPCERGFYCGLGTCSRPCFDDGDVSKYGCDEPPYSGGCVPSGSFLPGLEDFGACN